MQLGVLAVQPHQQVVGVAALVAEHARLHVVERGHVDVAAVLEVDDVQVPVLVPAGVLQVDDVAVVLAPGEAAHAALAIVRDGGGVVAAERPHPHVQHAVDRRDVRQPAAVRRHGGREPLGVAEEHVTRDQIDHRAAIVSRRRRRPVPVHCPRMDPRPIGMFDSGVGGLTVLHECLVTLPARGLRLLRRLLARPLPIRAQAGGHDPPLRARDRHPPGRDGHEAGRRRLQRRDVGGAARAAARVRGAADRRDHARGSRRGAGDPQPPRRRDGDAGDRLQRPLPGGGERPGRRDRGDAGRLSRPRAADPERRHPRPRAARGCARPTPGRSSARAPTPSSSAARTTR